MRNAARNLDRRVIGIGAFVLVLLVTIVSQGFGKPGLMAGASGASGSAGAEGGPWEANLATPDDLAAASDAQQRDAGPADILQRFSSAAPGPAVAGSAGTTPQAGTPSHDDHEHEHEAEVTRDLPADYVAGAPPSADLAATLRKSQERFNATQLPTAANAAVAVATSPKITFTRQSQIDDLKSGTVDPRIVDILTWIINRRQSITITSMKTDHTKCVAGSNPCRVSAHHMGRAVDIAAVDGQSCSASPTDNCAILYREIVNTLRGTQYQPSQIIHGFDDWPNESWNFAMGNHRHHIHIGY